MNYIIIGIKGSGCSALACYLRDKGYNIIGYDIKDYIYTEDNLKRHNIIVINLEEFSYNKDDIIIIGHNFMDSIYTTILDNDNMNYYEYNYFISTLNHEKLICIAGSHGKTTLTSMLAHVIPSSYIVGDGTGCYNPESPYLFLESCEYKDHYLMYKPYISIISNIDYDHVDYFKTKKSYIDSFKKFSKLSNKIITNSIDSKKLDRTNIITYSYDNGNSYTIKNYSYNNNGIKGFLYYNNKYIIDFNYNHLFGKHLLEDVILTFIFAHIENLDLNKIKERLYTYQMANKRFNKEELLNNIIINDYGHHPKQLETNYNTLKSMYNKPIVLIFKPDRVSRIEYFKKEFNKVFNLFNNTFILDFNDNKNKDLLKSFTNNKVIYLDDINDIKKYINFNVESVYLLSSSKSLDNIKNIIKRKIKSK